VRNGILPSAGIYIFYNRDLKYKWPIQSKREVPAPFPPERSGAPDFSGATVGDFKILKTLGSGTFGEVKLCHHITTGAYYCLKILDKSNIIRLKQEVAFLIFKSVRFFLF